MKDNSAAVMQREISFLQTELADTRAAVARAHQFGFDMGKQTALRECTAYRATIATMIGPLNVAVDRCMDRIGAMEMPRS